MQSIIEKANVLIEALPYIRSFYGKTFVIKYGGAAMTSEDLKDSFARDVVLLNFIGIKPVIVHGGGPKISSLMEKLGKKPCFLYGQRITDSETMDIVEMVLGGLINKEIVSLINTHGGSAVGLTGKDANLIVAQKKLISKISPETGVSEIIDLGLVGEVKEVNPKIIQTIQREGFIPVIAPIGVDVQNHSLNINADYVAGAVASILPADKLVLLTDTNGIMDNQGALIPSMTKQSAEELIQKGVIAGGMIPKVTACLDALEKGVLKAHVIDGRIPHCLLLEIFTQQGIGTEIVL
jgi:acetylglutamate kinase